MNATLLDAYRSLAAFAPGAPVPLAAAQRLWQFRWGLSAAQFLARLDALARDEMLELVPEGIRLDADPLDAPARAHADVLAAYRRLLADGETWSTLPVDEPYIWEHLVFHLERAHEDVASVVCDLAYLAVRVFRGGRLAAEDDLRRAAPTPTIAWLLEGFARWGHLLERGESVAEVAAALASRTTMAPPPIVLRTLDVLLGDHVLVPHGALPEPARALRRVIELDCRISAVAFSPDGLTLAGACSDAAVRLWESGTGRPTHTLRGHTRPVAAVAWGPDGLTLASAGADATIRLWDPDGACRHVLAGHAGAVASIAFSPDGTELASGGADGSVRFWSVARGECLRVIARRRGVSFRKPSPLHCLAYGEQLATCDEDGVVELWNAVTGKLVRRHARYTNIARAVAFSPDGHYLVGPGPFGICAWDLASGKMLELIGRHAAWTLAFSPDGQWLLSASLGVQLWDMAEPPGTSAPASRGGRLKRWLVEDEPERPPIAIDADGCTARAAAFSPDGATIAGGADSAVLLWDAGTAQVPHYSDYATHVSGLACSAELVAGVSNDRAVRLWNPENGELIATLLDGSGQFSYPNAPALSPDGRLLAAAGRVWDTLTRELRFTLTDLDSPLVFSPCGTLIAGGRDRLKIWEAGSGCLTHTLKIHGEWIWAVAFSPDGERLASASSKDTLELWDPVSGQRLASLPGPTDLVRALAFDGQVLVVRTSNERYAWDPAGGGPLRTLGHASRREARSPDGRFTAIACGDTVDVVDSASGDRVARLPIGVTANALVWGPAGLTAGARDGIVQLALVTRHA